jgi:hypothetical protein
VRNQAFRSLYITSISNIARTASIKGINYLFDNKKYLSKTHHKRRDCTYGMKPNGLFSHSIKNINEKER